MKFLIIFNLNSSVEAFLKHPEPTLLYVQSDDKILDSSNKEFFLQKIKRIDKDAHEFAG
jgi:hypothetical protein